MLVVSLVLPAGYGRQNTIEVAAQQSGLSQPTVSRRLAFVWESCQQPPEAISPRTSRIKRHDRREKLVALFHNGPAGELVTYREDSTSIQYLIHLPFDIAYACMHNPHVVQVRNRKYQEG
jgi:hypothetical protein